MSEERERRILERLLKKKQVSVKELAAELYVSEPSVRRDLARLEARNLIKRVHGGARLEETALSKNKIPFIVRELEQGSAKLKIAQRAAQMVEDDNVIFLDASTSAYNLIPFLKDKKNLTVVTNGIRALERLADFEINAVSTGGNLIASCLALVGDDAYRTIETVNADIAFFSCRGLSDDGYLTDIAPLENNVRRRMIAQSRRSYLLCTAEKMGKMYYHNLCHRDDIDGVITDID